MANENYQILLNKLQSTSSAETHRIKEDLMNVHDKIKLMREAKNWSQDEIIDFQKRELHALKKSLN